MAFSEDHRSHPDESGTQSDNIMSNGSADVDFSLRSCNLDDLSSPLLAEFEWHLAAAVVPDTTNELQLEGSLRQNGWPRWEDSVFPFNDNHQNGNNVYDPTLLSASRTDFNFLDDTGNNANLIGESPAEVPLLDHSRHNGPPGDSQMHDLCAPQKEASESKTELRGRSREVNFRMLWDAGETSSRRRQRPKQASETSWDEDDQMENFAEYLQEQLNGICEDHPNIEKFFITAHLKNKARRIVHALARLNHVNHMTLHDAGERRVLVTTATIRSRQTAINQKPWNARPSLWKLDPLAIIMALPLHVGREQLRDTLHRVNLPVPEDSCQLAYSQKRRLFLGVFRNTGDAAAVLQDLPTRYENEFGGSGPRPQIDISYRYWSEENSFDATFSMFGSPDEEHWVGNVLFLSDRGHRPAKRANHPPPAYAFHMSRPNSQSSMLRRSSSRDPESSDNDGYGSGRSRTSAKRPRTQFEVEDVPNRTQFAINRYSDGLKSRDASSDSNTTRRRFPRRPGGYPCRHPGCGKVFDTNGDRSKHECSHKPPEERPYACDYCEWRFNDTRDLKRHARLHS
jgi:hypothetical protein